MAQCVQCGRKGLFLKVNGRGLCDSCNQSRLESLFVLSNSGPGVKYDGIIPRGLSEPAVMKMLSDKVNNALRIVVDCSNIINTTSYPPTFYERESLLRAQLEYLIAIYAVDNKVFPKASPKALQDEFERSYQADEEKMWRRYFDQTMDRVVTLKTDKGKSGAIKKFFDMAEQYSTKMDAKTNSAIEGFRKRFDLKL